MNFKLKILSVLVLLSLNCFAMEIKQEIDPGVQSALASQFYQDLGKEAQFSVGIPEAQHVPIKNFPNLIKQLQSFAITSDTDIYIDEYYLDLALYGIQRCIIFHEAIHRKYNDLQYLKNVTNKALGLKFDSEENLKNYLKIYAEEVQQCRSFCEHRADTEGLYATQCYMCVNEYLKLQQLSFQEADETKNGISEKKMNYLGYATIDEMKKIVDNLMQQNKICAYHKINGTKLH
ncbi:hypothetical protein M1446_02900 [Candidatus Dependentiae bacterium]|nr:hypothetical protein [Candidatus Dependentiae bacterium]